MLYCINYEGTYRKHLNFNKALKTSCVYTYRAGCKYVHACMVITGLQNNALFSLLVLVNYSSIRI